MRNHFKHSVELVDREGDIVDVLAAVEDFLLAQATHQAARLRRRRRLAVASSSGFAPKMETSASHCCIKITFSECLLRSASCRPSAIG